MLCQGIRCHRLCSDKHQYCPSGGVGNSLKNISSHSKSFLLATLRLQIYTQLIGFSKIFYDLFITIKINEIPWFSNSVHGWCWANRKKSRIPPSGLQSRGSFAALWINSERPAQQ